MANVLFGDPLIAIEAKFDQRNTSCAARGEGWQHVGFSLPLSFLFCKHEVNHDLKHGTRIGEASHPVFDGGGARATARRRQEHEKEEKDEEMDGGMGGFADMLRPLIEKMIKQILEEIWEVAR